MTLEESLFIGAGPEPGWGSLAAIVGALALGLAAGVLVGRYRRRPEPRGQREEELASLRRIADEVSRPGEVEDVARTLLDEIASLFGVAYAALTFVSDDGREGSGFVARADGEDVAWWPDVRIDLVREPSGIASAVYEASSFAVYDVGGSKRISSRLAREIGARSAAFVPLIDDGRVVAVLSVATTDNHRAFTSDELAVMQTLASEATAALQRARTAIETAEALERERLLGAIARRLRAELDLHAVVRAIVQETGGALGASRCLLHLADGRGELRAVAGWAPGGEDEAGADWSPESALAVRERRTVAVADLADASELPGQTHGGATGRRTPGVRAVAASPLVADDDQLGVLTAQLDAPHVWSRGELLLLEGLAAEAALAIRVGRLLGESTGRSADDSGLERAADALSGELSLEALLDRLVGEAAQLLRADAADCHLYDGGRDVLRCAAVHGLDRSLVGHEQGAGHGLAGLAVRAGRPILGGEHGGLVERVPHDAYDGLTDVVVAPLRWGEDVLGTLRVARRGGLPFEPRDGDALGALATIASLAIRNADTAEQSRRRANVQRGSERIASLLGRSLSRAATLEAVAQAGVEALGGAAAAVLLPHGTRLVLAGEHALPPGLAELLRDGVEEADGPLARASARGRVVAAPSLERDQRVAAAWREQAGRDGYRALLAVPLETPRDESAGLVAVFFPEERAFADDELELARALAVAARAALERSELFEAERGARALAQQLTRTGRLLTTELDPAAVLGEVAQQAPALVNADACAIRLLDDGELVVTAAVGLGAESALHSRSSAAAWLSGDVLQSRSAVALEDAGSEERHRRLDAMLAAGHCAFLGVPLAGAEGAPLGVLAVYGREPRPWREEEVEALRALAASASAALRNAELYQHVALERERSVAILASIADGIVAVDGDDRVVLWNRAAEQITGVPADDALGRPPADVIRQGLDSGSETPVGDRLVSIMRGREEVWLSVTEAVMRDPAGAVSGRVFAFRDISSDRLVEQLKSDFVSTVSHELRAPLTSIYGFAETLLRQDVHFDERERTLFLGYIASESQRLTGIVDALLNVARLDTGDLHFDLGPTDVRDVVGDAVQTAKESAENDHRFVVELPPEPLAANADREKLRQVFSILLDNAVKYSRDGGTVTVGVERKHDIVEVSVADEGVGIPQAEQDQIFRKFYRGADAESRIGAAGTGLGLFIARGLVTAMGGRIWVESREGEGSTFAFELPAAGAAPAGTVHGGAP